MVQSGLGISSTKRVVWRCQAGPVRRREWFFFEADAAAFEETPERVQAHHRFTFAQFIQQRLQGQVRLFSHPRQQKVSLGFKEIGSSATHPSGRSTACFMFYLPPLHHTRNTDIKQGRRRTAGFSTSNRSHNTFTQIQRISSSHAC